MVAFLFLSFLVWTWTWDLGLGVGVRIGWGWNRGGKGKGKSNSSPDFSARSASRHRGNVLTYVFDEILCLGRQPGGLILVWSGVAEASDFSVHIDIDIDLDLALVLSIPVSRLLHRQ